MTRDEMLARVRRALGDTAVPALAPLAVGRPGRRAAAGPDVDDTPTLLARFADEARAVGAVVHAAPTPAAAGELLAALAAAVATRPHAVAWRSPIVTEVVAIARRLRPDLAIVDPADGDVRAAEIGVTEADALVAASGTLVLGSALHRHRGTSLLPRVHVALAPVERVVADLAAAFRRLADRDAVGSCLTLITGPSRTADIEKKLVLGVHGPCELHVVLLGTPAVTSRPAGAAAP